MLRRILKRPAFFFAVVLTLTLGIGANSAIFSVIDAVLLKPLPYPAGDRLMALYEVNPREKTDRGDVAPVRVEEWNRLSRSFNGIAAAYTESMAETSGALPERLVVARCSPRFFSVLGTPPLAGRGFSPEEDLFNGPSVAVLSEHLWRRRFNASPSAVGSTLRLGTVSYSIVGIARDSFRFPASDVDVWTAAGLPPWVMTNRYARFYTAVGRLREGVPPGAAQAELAGVQAQLAMQFPKTDANWTALVEPLKEETVGGARRSLWILYGAVSLVLLIACANVACLLLAQARQRRREIAIRFSLGARRWQIVRELLLESFWLALPGSVCGLLLSIAGTGLLRQAAAAYPRAEEIQIDWRIVAFTLSLSLLTTILFGLFPAFAATREEASTTFASTGSRTQIGGTGRALGTLVSAQIALAIVLLIGAGLLIRTLSRLGQVTLGFEPQHVLALRISASWGETNDLPKVRQRLVRTLETLRAIPGVESAAIANDLPGKPKDYPVEFKIVGRDSQGERLFSDAITVTSDYFRVMGIPILSGETCRANSDEKTHVTLVDRTFADHFFPNETPIGHSLDFGDGTPYQVIGVVGAVRQHGAARDPIPFVYVCEIPRRMPDPNYILKTSADPILIAEAVRRQVRSIEPNRAVFELARFTDYLSGTFSARKFQTTLLGLFAATALLLAVIGLYGVMSFFVSERTREIGLRIALGARPTQILSRILRIAAVMTAAGIALGLPAAALLTRSIQNQLYGVGVVDPVTFCAVPLLLILVAASAAWAPARRAMQIDPMEALRQE
jgi:putative ABC transport system permease protein